MFGTSLSALAALGTVLPLFPTQVLSPLSRFPRHSSSYSTSPAVFLSFCRLVLIWSANKTPGSVLGFPLTSPYTLLFPRRSYLHSFHSQLDPDVPQMCISSPHLSSDFQMHMCDTVFQKHLKLIIFLTPSPPATWSLSSSPHLSSHTIGPGAQARNPGVISVPSCPSPYSISNPFLSAYDLFSKISLFCVRLSKVLPLVQTSLILPDYNNSFIYNSYFIPANCSVY